MRGVYREKSETEDIKIRLHHHLSDSELNERADIVSEDFATNGSCNIFVNEWAQLAIFRVMNLNEKG